VLGRLACSRPRTSQPNLVWNGLPPLSCSLTAWEDDATQSFNPHSAVLALRRPGARCSAAEPSSAPSPVPFSPPPSHPSTDLPTRHCIYILAPCPTAAAVPYLSGTADASIPPLAPTYPFLAFLAAKSPSLLPPPHPQSLAIGFWGMRLFPSSDSKTPSDLHKFWVPI
jgi:hypothetical protein